MIAKWFWWFLAMACVVWYLTITVYVSVKGVADIKQMLRRLSENQVEDSNGDV
jgi:hypothetical protein